MAEKLGQPFMPWQRYVADVGGEIDPATGLPAYREVRVTVPRQSGKALDVATPILTANRGWTTMGALRRGDAVFHPDGFPVRVTFVSDVMHNHECFRVTTVDGRSVVADAEHMWSVTDKRAERTKGSRPHHVSWFEQRIVTTREMVRDGLSRYPAGGRTSVTGGKRYATNEYRFVLPSQEPLKSADVRLPIDPYLFGAWLGDGTSASGTLTCHVLEVPHWSAAVEAAGFMPVVRPGGGTADTRTVSMTTTLGAGRKARSFAGRLRRLGVLGDKHVPDLYLTAGTGQREALLQGLMDTDGTVDSRAGHAEFCSTSPRLAQAVLFLARSLGWRATLRTGRATLRGKDCGEKYRVCFTPKRADPFAPFRLPRKVARVQERDGGKGRATLSVASIEPVESVPVRCIKVDSPDGLFLAGRDLVPTHNTTLFLAWQINRCVSRRWSHPQRSAFTAQTGKDARDKWIDELFPLIRNSQLKSLVATTGSRLVINEGMGNESIKFRTGSLIRLLSTSTSSGHSKTLHQAVMDEVWHDIDDRREQGLRPAMITIPDAQLLVCSTAGTEASVILNRKVETGRAAVEADVGVGVAYFEWSAPERWDPDDEASYFTFMPALCPNPPCRCALDGSWRHTITSLDAIRAERSAMELPEFVRAYGNRPTKASDAQWRVISEDDWTNYAQDPDSSATGRVAFSLDVNPERTAAALGVAGQRADGDLHAEVVDHRPGKPTWAVGRLAEVCRKWKPAAVVVDPAGAAGALIPDIEEALKPLGIELTKLTGRQVAAAWGKFRDGVSSEPDTDSPDYEPAIGEPTDLEEAVEVEPVRRIRVRPHPALTLAVAGAAKRRVGDGSAWDRKSQTVDICPLVAVTNAVFGFITAPEPEPVSTVPLVAWR